MNLKLIIGAILLAVASETFAATPTATSTKSIMNKITTKDGTGIFFKDWGSGQPIVFSHGWPLNSDSWESQMLFLASQGYRCIAHDRRGHGRSTQTWGGHNMDTYADDLATLIEKLDLKNVVLVGFSTGGGEVARYLGRHGSKRVAKLVLAGAVTPLMIKTANNPDGVPVEVIEGLRKSSHTNRSQLYKDIGGGAFYGFNRAGVTPSPGLADWFWAQGMMAAHNATYDCIEAFSATDFNEDLKKVSVPTLVVHGDDDQLVPFKNAQASAKLVKGARLIVYAGAPHGFPDTHKDRFNADLLSFIREPAR
jgi:non-heme chloroperoxidase